MPFLASCGSHMLHTEGGNSFVFFFLSVFCGEDWVKKFWVKKHSSSLYLEIYASRQKSLINK